MSGGGNEMLGKFQRPRSHQVTCGGAIYAGPNLVLELEAGAFYTAVCEGLTLINFCSSA